MLCQMFEKRTNKNINNMRQKLKSIIEIAPKYTYTQRTIRIGIKSLLSSFPLHNFNDSS